ncbi:MAG: hypothetical protein ACHQJ4_01050 [Ignavibacteria bacterium]
MKKLFFIVFLLLTFLTCGCETLKTYYLDKKEIPVEQQQERQARAFRLKDIFIQQGMVKKL